jgi:hypothetical protein
VAAQLKQFRAFAAAQRQPLMITLLRGDSPGPQFFVSADPKDWIHGKSVDGTSLTPPRCLRSGNKTRRCPQPLTLGFAGAPIP